MTVLRLFHNVLNISVITTNIVEIRGCTLLPLQPLLWKSVKHKVTRSFLLPGRNTYINKKTCDNGGTDTTGKGSNIHVLIGTCMYSFPDLNWNPTSRRWWKRDKVTDGGSLYIEHGEKTIVVSTRSISTSDCHITEDNGDSFPSKTKLIP